MPTITDEYMRARISQAKNYTIVILKKTDKRTEPGAEMIAWEHARRNMSLSADGMLCVVCPVSDETDIAGVGIFNAGMEETKRIMDGDPGVMAGVFTYDLHPCMGFPGSTLP